MIGSNLSHFEMMKQLHQYIRKWSPIIWTGWNSLGFDFVMLQKENYKALLPIYITNTQGSEHSDFLQVARTSKLFFPDCIKTFLSDKGNAIFKLDSLGPLNFPDLDTKKFHTAIQDCETLLRVMKKLKQGAEEIFEASKLTTSKFSAKEKIETERVFTICFYFYGKIDKKLFNPHFSGNYLGKFLHFNEKRIGSVFIHTSGCFAFIDSIHLLISICIY